MDLQNRRSARRPWRQRTAEERARALDELRRRQQAQIELEVLELELLSRR